MTNTLSMSGTLPIPDTVPAPVPDPGPESVTEELIAEVIEVRAARGDMDQVMRLLRQTPLWVETEQDEDGQSYTVRSVQTQGLRWLPVFSALEHLARFAQASGRGDQHIQYGQLPGAELLDEVLPALPHGTGLVLDPVADHVLALPAVRGIVPDALAVDGGRA